VNPPLPSGAVAPLDELTSTVLPVTATIVEFAGDVFFSGLTGGFVGLYQVNVFIKPGTPTGSQVPVVPNCRGSVQQGR